jgi:glycerol-3-phosphate dehydrogenase
MTLRYTTDIVIFGGGVAGLWLLNRLRQEGLRAILLEAHNLGGGQTMASQGIIHGGLKYALSGSLTGAAEAIASMPARWRQCLQGDDALDLSGVKVLSEHYYMWSESGLRSKLKTFLGSKTLRGRVTAVARQDYPDFFAGASVDGSLYQLPDFVVDTGSLVAELADKQKEFIFKIDPAAVSVAFRKQSGAINKVIISGADGSVTIDTNRVVFCAGEGNRALIASAGLTAIETQLRPLHMVYLKSRELPLVYVHCIGDSFSLTPRLTVTSHRDHAGETVWYLGGEIAESGVGKTADQQQAAARQLLEELFPWIDCSSAQWHCFNINRAEADINNNYRPDGAHFMEQDNVVVAWPTKLTLAPSLADQLLDLFSNMERHRLESDPAKLRSLLPLPELAAARWG